MPIIEGADLSNVSTERELLPEGEYLFTILDSELSEDGNSLIIKRRVEEAPPEGEKFVGQENWDWINIVDKQGKRNEIGYQTLKKYLEAVFGKGSDESNVADSDPLHGHQVRIYIEQKGSKKDPDKLFQNNKRIMAA